MTLYLNLINISRLTDDHTSLILFTSGCYTIQISRNIEKEKGEKSKKNANNNKYVSEYV